MQQELASITKPQSHSPDQVCSLTLNDVEDDFSTDQEKTNMPLVEFDKNMTSNPAKLNKILCFKLWVRVSEIWIPELQVFVKMFFKK